MTGLAQLLVDCEIRGIRLIPATDGGLTIDAPRDALTHELVELIRTHKLPLIRAMLPPAAVTQPPPEITAEDNGGDGWLDGSDEVPKLEACPTCGSLEMWQSAGLNPRWRCMTCDPPTTALRLLERIRQEMCG